MSAAVASLCLFCGSRTGDDPAHAASAQAFGAWTAHAGLRIVYGGGAIGLMGVAARAALAAGGEVVGVIPRFLMRDEIAQPGLTELVVVESLHARKALMFERSDAILALPGGIGTLDELCEVMTWRQLGLHAKPILLLGDAGFWTPFLAMLDHLTKQGFIDPAVPALIEPLPDLPALARRLALPRPAP